MLLPVACQYCYIDAPHGRWLNRWRKSLTAITQECCEQYWTSPEYNTPQSSSYTATYYPSQKQSKLDKPDMRDTSGEVGTNLWVMYSCEPFHMDEQRQDVQFEPTYSSSAPIWDVALRIWWKQWTIGRCGERRSGISMLIAWHDNDDIYPRNGVAPFPTLLCNSYWKGSLLVALDYSHQLYFYFY